MVANLADWPYFYFTEIVDLAIGKVILTGRKVADGLFRLFL